MFLTYEDRSLCFEDLYKYITTREANVCVLTLNILVLFLSLYCSVLCKFYCFLVFTLRSDIISVYSLLCLMNHCLTSGCEFCIMYSEMVEKCVFFLQKLQKCLVFCVQNDFAEFLLS